MGVFNWNYENQQAVEDEFSSFIRAPDFPCVGAKSALGRGSLKVVACRSIASAWDDVRIHDITREWAVAHDRDPGLFRSLAFVFDGPSDLDEEAFERHMWDRLLSMTEKDEWRGIPADK